jgi:hypothetical protein
MSVPRFKTNDAVFILPKYAHLYTGNSAVVSVVHANPFRLGVRFARVFCMFSSISRSALYLKTPRNQAMRRSANAF